ncbi:hypothetical protein DICSQDRAFT_46116 [Dichomitus squalens LYAD-421 SS1]|uniref:uncharacterized protein n=1 Tax=Dichomitus squalens (strain LYAD-421) TaxID=732165 RepID=UPI00044161AA|nr:uncharacterized protein DICSQDRAFT_46116 [Dichomitus squalens LYAD-421 SS1]EJF67057.1 hypothetical protein DICSQDRAFT_46116 [Dichomitus squalens LYAD-421 SS1]
MASDIQQLLGCKPYTSKVTAHIAALAEKVSKPDATTPEVKAYPDAVYFNYYALGISLLFKPVGGYVPRTGLKLEELQDRMLVLDGVDVYNNPPPKAGANASRATKSPYTSYPISPITLNLVAIEAKERPSYFNVTSETTGKEFVSALGEPDRKGGGAGPSSGSINIWCEWTKDGIMVEFGGEESRGPQAWERGKDAVWKVISIFSPKED